MEINSNITGAFNEKDSLTLVQVSSLLDPSKYGENRENLAAAVCVCVCWGGGGNNCECNKETFNPKGIQATLPHNSLAETSQMLTTVGPGSTISR